MSELSIYQSLANVMVEVQAVSKTDRNSQQGFNFRGIDAVVNAVGPALRKHSVIVTPSVLSHTYETIEIGRNRTQMAHVVVKVAYRFHGPAGDHIDAVVIGEAMDSGDKAVAKAMSVAFRIALLQALALPTDEPDPDSYSYERSEPKPTATPDQWQEWVDRMTDAETLDALNAIATEAAGYEMREADREELRGLYIIRRDDIRSGKQSL